MRAALDRLCGAGKWRAYCISLPRCTERRAAFTAWAAAVDLPFSFWDAVDKLDLSGEPVVRVGKVPSAGAEACRRSHEALYRHCLGQPEAYFLILEDDAGYGAAVARGDCDAGNEDNSPIIEFTAAVGRSGLPWAMVQFGYHTAATTQIALYNPAVDKRLYRYDVADQAHAILFRKKTVRELLDLCSQEKFQARPIDGIINIYQTRRMGLCIGPEVSLIRQVDSKSFIWE